MSADILGLGEALIEFTRQPERARRPIYSQGFGGDTSNAIVAAARQLASTGYITAVGNDIFGRELVDFWKSEGVSTDNVTVRDGDPTGCYFVQPHESGRDFSYARRGSAASLYSPHDLPLEAIAKARVLHVSAISQAISPSMRKAVGRAVKIARENRTLVSFDTNLRLGLWSIDEARAALGELLPAIDILLPSDDEAELLTGISEPEQIVAHFHQFGPGIIVLKRGSKGALLSTGEGIATIPPHPSSPVDSTGAGDSFAGAFLAHFLETGQPEYAARTASQVAAETVSAIGAIDAIPHRRTA